MENQKLEVLFVFFNQFRFQFLGGDVLQSGQFIFFGFFSQSLVVYRVLLKLYVAFVFRFQFLQDQFIRNLVVFLVFYDFDFVVFIFIVTFSVRGVVIRQNLDFIFEGFGFSSNFLVWVRLDNEVLFKVRIIIQDQERVEKQ